MPWRVNNKYEALILCRFHCLRSKPTAAGERNTPPQIQSRQECKLESRRDQSAIANASLV